MIGRVKIVLSCLVVSVLALPVDAAINVFGDSLSDTGNTRIATSEISFLPEIPGAVDGYDQGRFSNGPVWVEVMATSLGRDLPRPSRDGGSNAAHGGSEVLSSGFLQPSLAEQVAGVETVAASDLNVIWLGAADLLNTPLSDLPGAELRVLEAIAEIRRNVDQLYDRGARQFLVLNLPSLAVVPLSVETLDDEELAARDRLTDQFNVELSRQLEEAREAHSPIELLEFDAHALFNQVLADPAGFGFSNVTDAAAPFAADGLISGLATGPPPLGTDVDSYLFFDGLHPTARTHSLLGQRVAEWLTVPEPSGLRLWQLGLLTMSWVMRATTRRRATS